MQLPVKTRPRLVDVVTNIGSTAMPYVSLKGGAFTLVDSNGEQREIKTKYLDCIIIDVLEWDSRVYWGNRAFDPTADSYQAPECFSDNNKGASRNALNPQSARCDTCPQNIWGSAISKVSGKGIPACGSLRKIAVLAYLDGANDDEGHYAGSLVVSAEDKPIPFLLRVPVMSLNNLKAFGGQFKGQSFDIDTVVTRIMFKHGEVGVIDFIAYGHLGPDTKAEVTKILETDLTDQLVGRNDQPITELPGKAAAETVERPKPVAPPQTAQSMEITPSATAKAARGRPRTKPVALEATSGPFAAPQQPRTAPFATQQPSHGIVSNAGSPPGEVERQLDSLFNLKSER